MVSSITQSYAVKPNGVFLLFYANLRYSMILYSMLLYSTLRSFTLLYAPLHLYASMPLCLYTSSPLCLYTSTPRAPSLDQPIASHSQPRVTSKIFIIDSSDESCNLKRLKVIYTAIEQAKNDLRSMYLCNKYHFTFIDLLLFFSYNYNVQ